jgi:hypothetical protein
VALKVRPPRTGRYRHDTSLACRLVHSDPALSPKWLRHELARRLAEPQAKRGALLPYIPTSAVGSHPRDARAFFSLAVLACGSCPSDFRRSARADDPSSSHSNSACRQALLPHFNSAALQPRWCRCRCRTSTPLHFNSAGAAAVDEISKPRNKPIEYHPSDTEI